MSRRSKRATRVEDEWFEFEEQDWLPRRSGKKLRLLADVDVPIPVLNELRDSGIDIPTDHRILRGRDDEAVLQMAHQSGRVLLTLDSHFWDDRKYPLHRISGIILLSTPYQDVDAVLTAFALLYVAFAKHYPHDWWDQMKVRATKESLFFKMRSYEGRNVQYEVRLRNSVLQAREIRV